MLPPVEINRTFVRALQIDLGGASLESLVPANSAGWGYFVYARDQKVWYATAYDPVLKDFSWHVFTAGGVMSRGEDSIVGPSDTASDVYANVLRATASDDVEVTIFAPAPGSLLISLSGATFPGFPNGQAEFRIEIDGVGDDGANCVATGASGAVPPDPISFGMTCLRSVAPGIHSIKVQWRNFLPGQSSNLDPAQNVNGQNYPLRLTVVYLP
jgi:hypothetical protein